MNVITVEGEELEKFKVTALAVEQKKLKEKRAQKQELVKKLSDLITDCQNDDEFFEILTWTLTWVSNQIASFATDEI